MTRDRADEIVRKVIYVRLNTMPRMKDSEDAFHVGRMIGSIQRQLEVELEKEVESSKESETEKTTRSSSFIGCNSCIYKHKKEHEEPCKICCHNYVTYFKKAENEVEK